MFTLSSDLKFHLYGEFTDMRKSFDSLSGIIRNHLSESPQGGDVFIFMNKRRNKLKMLHWGGSGFVLYYKRLESGTFEHFRYALKGGSYLLGYAQAVMLIDGICIKNLQKKNQYSSS